MGELTVVNHSSECHDYGLHAALFIPVNRTATIIIILMAAKSAVIKLMVLTQELMTIMC